MNLVERICRILNMVAYGATGVMMLLTVTDVILRLLPWTRPIIGVTEISELLMLFLCWGMALAALENSHIRVDIIVNRLSPRGKAVTQIVSQMLGMAVVVLVVWQTIKAGLYAKGRFITSAMLEIPDWPFYMMLAGAFIVLGIAMIILIIRSVEVLRK